MLWYDVFILFCQGFVGGVIGSLLLTHKDEICFFIKTKIATPEELYLFLKYLMIPFVIGCIGGVIGATVVNWIME